MKPIKREQLFVKSLVEESLNKKLNDASVVVLTGDASTRRYYRIHEENNKYVVCMDEPHEKKNENLFLRIQHFLYNRSIRVPKIIDSRFDIGYILEEDLGNITLLNKLSIVKSVNEERNLYLQAIDLMIKMHQISVQDIKNEKLFDYSFDLEKLNFESSFTKKYFLEKYLKIDESRSQRITELFEKINSRLIDKDFVFTHRDYHSRNLMFKDDELVVIDFQDARFGLPQYDLCSLLEDAYYYLSDEVKSDLIRYYYQNSGVNSHQSYDEFLAIYIDMSIQRIYKAIGSFSYIYDKRADIRYLKYIGYCMEKIRSLMLNSDKYDELRVSLFKYYYES